jgi:hypothetical protein
MNSAFAEITKVAPGRDYNPASSRWQALVVALLLVIAVYPDVIFFRASLSLSNFYNFSIEPAVRKVQILPERKGRQPYHGMYDAGGAIFQSEPAQQFMRHVIWDFESPYWNPYSATGSLGPETLVDIKFSPVSIATALLGGSDVAFHLVYLGFTVFGVWCLLVLFRCRFALSWIASIAGGIAYLLNGFHVANLGSNTSQTWLYFPVLLLALVAYGQKPCVRHFFGIAAASILILATTFLPTMLLCLATTALFGAMAVVGEQFSRQAIGFGERARHSGVLVAAQATGIILGLAVLAFLYLPIAEAMRYLGNAEFYAQRVFIPANWITFISVFTPKHVFEINNAITAEAVARIGNQVFHQGITCVLVASLACRAWPVKFRPLIVALFAVFLLFLARSFAVPGVVQVLAQVPVFGNLGEQYTWISISIALILLVAFGAEALLERGTSRLPATLVATVILAALCATTVAFGIHGLAFGFYVAVDVALVGTALYLIFTALRGGEKAPCARVLLVVLIFVELMFDVNHYRLAREDRFSHPPDYVRFLQLNSGISRIASYGPYGMPPEYGSAFQLQEIGSMNFNTLPAYFDFFTRLLLPDPKDRWPSFITLARTRDTDAVNLAALDFLAVRYVLLPYNFERQGAFMRRSGWREVISFPYIHVWENPHLPPRAFIVPRLLYRPLTPLDDHRSPREIAYTDDPLLLADARRLGIATEDGEVETEGLGEVAITRFHNAGLDLMADLKRPGILVLPDAWYPNWRAVANGSPVRVGRVDEAFRGIALPAGRWKIEMRYRPRTLNAGLTITALALLLSLGILLGRRRVDRWLGGSTLISDK